MAQRKPFDEWVFSHPARFAVIIVGAILLLLGILIAAVLGRSAVPEVPAPTMVGYDLSGMLAAGTLALAYATGYLAQSARSQARVSEAQLEVARDHLRALRDQNATSAALARAASSQAATAEALRKNSTFPRLRIVAQVGRVGAQSVSLIPGSYYGQAAGPIPTLGIENWGNGPASGVRISASWKVFDFVKAKTATAAELLSIPWSKVPALVPVVDTIEPHAIEWVDPTPWTQSLVEGHHLQRRAVALCIRADWVNPDGVREPAADGGLALLAQSFSKDPANDALERTVYFALGIQDKPRDEDYSEPPPVVI
jgi:hypothetical protein